MLTEMPYPCRSNFGSLAMRPGGRGKRETAEIDVRLTDQTLTCAARALVATAARRTACLHVSRAMQAARP